jgi:hypothetical protein
MFFPVPGTWAAGNYEMWGRVGGHPDYVWDESGFPFVKSGASDGSAFVPTTPENWANPFFVDAEVAATAQAKHVENTLDAQWDLLFSSEAGVTVGDNQLLGGEFAVDKFYVTGGNSAGEPNQVYVLNADGTLNFQFDQWSSAGWGWRDLAYDGTYLYGSDDYTVDAFDLTGAAVPAMNISGPYSPCRALAYDPVTDHFWTASFSSPLYEFDRSGNVIWSGSTGLTAVYGAAWDDAAPDGPWLWLHDQTGGCVIHQFDPINHTLTGVSYTLPILPGSTSQMAGGLFFTEEFDPAFFTIGGVTQGTPEDQVFILEMYDQGPPTQYNVIVELTYQSGSPVPAGGGNLYFDVYVENQDTQAADFDAWLDVEYEGGAPSTMVLRSFTNYQPDELPAWLDDQPSQHVLPGSGHLGCG